MLFRKIQMLKDVCKNLKTSYFKIYRLYYLKFRIQTACGLKTIKNFIKQ